MRPTPSAPASPSRLARRHGRALAALVVLTVLGTGCSAVTDRVDDMRSTVSGVAERARACVDLVQTVAGIEEAGPEADPEQALEALRDLAERSPEAVSTMMEELGELAQRAQEIEARGGNPATDPELRSAARELASRAVALCATG